MIYDSGYLTGIYHGDLLSGTPNSSTTVFNNDIPVIVATSAFGMGINKKIFVQSYIFIYHLHHLTIYKKLSCDGVQSQAISLFQPDDSFILETLLFTDIITDDDITMFETGNHFTR